MPDLQTAANSIVGVISPLITQLVRDHVIKCDGKAAHFLSIGVAAICVALAFWTTGTKFAWVDFGADVGMAFTISQVIYHTIMRDESDKANKS